MVYVVLYIWLWMCGLLLLGKSSDKRKRVFLFLFFTGCALVMGLRSYEVGIDTHNYYSGFYRISNMTFSEIFKLNHDVGFSLIEKLFSLVAGNYYFFQFVMSMMYCYGMAYFIYYISNKYLYGELFSLCFIFLGLGMYLYTFNVFRQMFAAMLVVNSWILLDKGKLVKAAVLFVFASTIHISSIVFALAYMLYFLSRKHKWMAYVLPIGLIIIYFNIEPIINLAVSIGFFEQYSEYLDMSFRLEGGGIVFVWIIIVLLAVLIIYNKQTTSNEKMLSAFSIIYVLFMVLGSKIAYLDRISLYFLPFALFTFIRFRQLLKLSKQYNAISSIYNVILCIGFSMFYFRSISGSDLIYSFFFNN